MVVKIRGKILGILMLVFIVVLSICVKYGLLPVPVVASGELSGYHIKGTFHQYTVPNEAIIEEQGKSYIYIIDYPKNYWLDGDYASKTEVEAMDNDDVNTSIVPVNPTVVFGHTTRIVLDPLQSFSNVQKIRIKAGSKN